MSKKKYYYRGSEIDFVQVYDNKICINLKNGRYINIRPSFEEEQGIDVKKRRDK